MCGLGTLTAHVSCFLREEGISTILSGRENMGKTLQLLSFFRVLQGRKWLNLLEDLREEPEQAQVGSFWTPVLCVQ